MFHTYRVIFSEALSIFLAQNFQTYVDRAKKNQVLECLNVTWHSKSVWLYKGKLPERNVSEAINQKPCN